jgi:hypothetical protein
LNRVVAHAASSKEQARVQIPLGINNSHSASTLLLMPASSARSQSHGHDAASATGAFTR